MGTATHSSRSPKKKQQEQQQHQRRSESHSPRKKRQTELADFLAVSGDGLFLNRTISGSSPTRRIRSRTASSSCSLPRRMTTADKERQERIDRENRILLRKILEQHHGIRRQSSIPPPAQTSARNSTLMVRSRKNHQSSRKINQERIKHKTDYENLILLQKIQNVRPSRDIEHSFNRLSIK